MRPVTGAFFICLSNYNFYVILNTGEYNRSRTNERHAAG